ncbi:MAG: aldo/keto reductase [Nitrososphaerota archaeon]|nr:aldo/keto reductase [Nitrososphaerota archaeon]
MRYREFARTGFKLSTIGMGTYYDPVWIMLATLLGIQRGRESKLKALTAGLDSGINFIDTAEIYRSESIVADAIAGRKRDEIFIASKVWSNHLKPEALAKACKKSLERLHTPYIDLDQIHFPSSRVPIKETMGAMEDLMEKGMIRSIGISNFSYAQLVEAVEAMKKHEISSVQLNYNLAHRDVEREILPYCEKENIALIAYYPLGHGKLARDSRGIKEVVSNRAGKISPPQVALSWLTTRSECVYPIPRASTMDHVKEDALAGDVVLSQEEMEMLDKRYPR